MRGNFRRYFFALVVLAALGLIAYHSRHRIHITDFTWSKLKTSVAQADIWLLLLALLGIYGAYAIRAVRWQRFSRYCGQTRFLDVFNGTVMGFAAIFILGRPGEPVRPLLLARKSKCPVAAMFGIWVLERLFDFGGALGLATFSLLIFPSNLSQAGVNEDWVEQARTSGPLFLGIFLILVAVMLYFRLHGAGALERRLKSWVTASGWRRWVAAFVSGFSEGLQAIRTYTDLLLAVAYTAAHWGLVALVYLVICRAFGDAFYSPMNFTGAMLLLAVTLVGSTIQLPGVGGGAQFASIIALTTIFGLDQEPAVAVAVVLWLITFASPAFVGLPLLIHEGLSMGELRKLARAEAEAEAAGEHLSLTGIGWRPGNDRKPKGSTP